MSVSPKSAKDKPADPSAGKAETPETNMSAVAVQLHQGIEKLASLQNSALEILSQQTAGANRRLRETLSSSPDASGMLLLDVAEQAVQGWVTAQRNLMDLMVRQSNQAVETTKEAGSSSKSLRGLNELIEHAAKQAAAGQKAVIEFAENQTKIVSEAVKRQSGTAAPGSSVAEAMQGAVAVLLENQKEFLEVAAKLPKIMTAR